MTAQLAVGDVVVFTDERRPREWEVVHAGPLWVSVQRLKAGYNGTHPVASVRQADAGRRLRLVRKAPRPASDQR